MESSSSENSSGSARSSGLRPVLAHVEIEVSRRSGAHDRRRPSLVRRSRARSRGHQPRAQTASRDIVGAGVESPHGPRRPRGRSATGPAHGRLRPAAAADLEPARSGMSTSSRTASMGAGFKDGDLPYVFDRFYRASDLAQAARLRAGLAIVRQVAESHGASVQAENAQGGGAVLRMFIQRKPRSRLDPVGRCGPGSSSFLLSRLFAALQGSPLRWSPPGPSKRRTRLVLRPLHRRRASAAGRAARC